MKLASGFVWSALLVATVGCGGANRNEVAPVRGLVTLDGTPYTQGGSVVFHPETPCKMATGRIQADGSFEMTTYTAGDGAAVGKHKVTVFPRPLEIVDELAEENLTKGTTSPIPNRYASASTSGLVFDVLAGRTNEFPIELKSR